MTATEVTADDDRFHPPAADDPFWTETAWFGFSIPERRISGAVYPLFRPNQGVCAGGVYVWDDSAENLHEILYGRNYWHLPLPDDLAKLRLLSGLEYDVVEPLHTYDIRYQDGSEIDLRLRFEAIHPPHAPAVGAHGHLDQAGRVTGTLVLAGEEIAVDCIEMRDRSWSVRRDNGPMRAAYDYGFAGPDHGFLAMSISAGADDLVVAGYRLVDGRMVKLTGGTRTVERVDGRPALVRIAVDDADGGRLEAMGRCVNRFAFQSSPNYFAWMSLMEWDLGGRTGWGQDQDVWSPDLLRVARRERLMKQEKGES